MTIPPCVGKHDLFDSDEITHVRQAMDICATCPMIEACRDRRDNLMADGFTPYGTWAGWNPIVQSADHRVGRGGDRDKARMAREDARYSDAEAREAAQAYKRQDRSVWAVVGNRVYQRRMKARQRPPAKPVRRTPPPPKVERSCACGKWLVGAAPACKECLMDVLTRDAERTIDAVADHLHVSAADLRAGSRARDVARARHVVAWILRRNGWSFNQVGTALNVHHTTVMTGVQKVEANHNLRRSADLIREGLTGRAVA